MYVIIASMKIKEGHKKAFIEALLEDAKASVRDEVDCFRFDVIQDAGDSNLVWSPPLCHGKRCSPRG